MPTECFAQQQFSLRANAHSGVLKVQNRHVVAYSPSTTLEAGARRTRSGVPPVVSCARLTERNPKFPDIVLRIDLGCEVLGGD